jgi:hypothetical protein
VSEFYDRLGVAISMQEWSELNRDRAYKRIDETQVGDLWVSTIWLGLDHGFGFHSGSPTIFETMVFGPGSWSELYCQRYATEAEARDGHRSAVLVAKARQRGWAKHTRDENRRQMKYMIKLLNQKNRTELEELLLRSWLRRKGRT